MNTILEHELEQIYRELGNRTDAFANQSILITGATGLIGSYLVDFFVWLNKNHNSNVKIFATATSARHSPDSNITYIQCDLSIPNTFNSTHKFDRIIHAAGPTDPKIYAQNPAGVMKTNIIGTMQILDTAIKSNTQVLFISSGEVYGNNTDHAFTEQDKCTIDTRTARACYPAAKAACEALCQSYANMHDLHINIVRPGFVYGPNISDTSSRVNAYFLRSAISGTNIVLNSYGNQKRTWVYVADTASAILHVLLNAPRGEIYNIAAPQSVATIYEHACELANITGINVEIAPNATMATNADSVLDATKLTTLGWRAHYDLATGLKHCVLLKR